ncbi:MAG: hypothetical protein AAF443_05755 [Chlamydiota bacterium]
MQRKRFCFLALAILSALSFPLRAVDNALPGEITIEISSLESWDKERFQKRVKRDLLLAALFEEVFDDHHQSIWCDILAFPVVTEDELALSSDQFEWKIKQLVVSSFQESSNSQMLLDFPESSEQRVLESLQSRLEKIRKENIGQEAFSIYREEYVQALEQWQAPDYVVDYAANLTLEDFYQDVDKSICACKQVLLDSLLSVEGSGMVVCHATVNEDIKFFNEALSQVDKEKKTDVKRLIKKLNEKSKAKLLNPSTTEKLMNLGDKVDGIHPMIFLGIICEKGVQEHLGGILNDFWKKTGFINGLFRTGFGDRMKKERKEDKDKLMRYAYGLANLIGCHSADLIDCINEENWERLLRIVAS